MAVTPQDEMLTVKEVAQILHMHEKTLYRKISPNSKDSFPIKPKRVGRKVLFPRKRVEAFIHED